ncbi:putative ribonuclease H-like domain-containing protein [Tanacetum coccineum]
MSSLTPSTNVDLQAPEVIAPIPEAVAPEHAVSTGSLFLNSIPADNVPAGRSSSIPADYVSAGHVLVPADIVPADSLNSIPADNVPAGRTSSIPADYVSCWSFTQLQLVPNIPILPTIKISLSREGKILRIMGYEDGVLDKYADIIFGGIVQQGTAHKRLGKKDAKGKTIVHPPGSLDEKCCCTKGKKIRFEKKAGTKDELQQSVSCYDLTEEMYSAFKVTEVKTDEPKALVSVDSMVNWSDHAAENTTGEVEKVYGMMAGLHADSADASDAAAEFAMMGISPKSFDLSTPSVFTSPVEKEVKPLYSRFVKAGEMHDVPPPITGTYMPSPYQSDIEETQVMTSLQTQRTMHPVIKPQDQTKDIPPELNQTLQSLMDDGELLLRPQQVTLGGITDHNFGDLRVMLDLVNPHGFTLNDPQGRLKSRMIVNLDFGGDGRISGKGTIRTSKLDFENVYYVEELQHFNLFSVVLRIPRKHVLTHSTSLTCHPRKKVTCFMQKASLDESTRWHRRMAHVNFKTINKLAKEGLVDGLPLKVFTNEHNCVAYAHRKQHKASYKNISAVRLIYDYSELLHMDLFVYPISGVLDRNTSPSVLQMTFAGSSSSNGPSIMERNADYAEELAKLQRQEYEAKDAAARYGYLFSQATAEILCQAEAEIRNQGVSAVTDPAGIDSAVREPAGIVSADGVSTGSPSADSDPAGSNPADCFPPAGSVEPTDESNPAVSSSVSAEFNPVYADESTLPPGQQLGSSENTTRFPVPSDVCMDQNLHCAFSPSFLQPTSIAKALEDPDWVDAMQEEMQQFINQQCLFQTSSYSTDFSSECSQENFQVSKGATKTRLVVDVIYGQEGCLHAVKRSDYYRATYSTEDEYFEYLVVHDWDGGSLLSVRLRGSQYLLWGYLLPASLVSAGSSMFLLVVILPAASLVSAGSSMFLLVVILPAASLVSAGSSMFLLVVILPAASLVSAVILPAGRMVSAGWSMVLLVVIFPAARLVSAGWSMVLLVVIFPAARLVSAGCTMVLLEVIVPAGFFVPAGSYGLSTPYKDDHKPKMILGILLRERGSRTSTRYPQLLGPLSIEGTPLTWTLGSCLTYGQKFWQLLLSAPNAAGFLTELQLLHGSEVVVMRRIIRAPVNNLMMPIASLVMQIDDYFCGGMGDIGLSASMEALPVPQPPPFSPVRETTPGEQLRTESEPVIFGPLPRLANYIAPEDIDNLNSMEDDTILGGFHEETHAGPDDAPTTTADAARRAEDPALLTSLSAKIDRCMGRIIIGKLSWNSKGKYRGSNFDPLYPAVKKLGATRFKTMRSATVATVLCGYRGHCEEEEVPLGVRDLEIPAVSCRGCTGQAKLEENRQCKRFVQQLQELDELLLRYDMNTDWLIFDDAHVGTILALGRQRAVERTSSQHSTVPCCYTQPADDPRFLRVVFPLQLQSDSAASHLEP